MSGWTSLVNGIVELDEMGYIVTDENMQTSVQGVFAAGDVRRKLLRQIVTACADGAIAATAAEKYLESMPTQPAVAAVDQRSS